MAQNLAETEAVRRVDFTRELGKTGIRVFPVGLGAMQLSMQGRPDEARAIEVIRAALDAGVNFIDTANVYCAGDDEIGHNERLIAKALQLLGAGTSVLVATKGGVDRRRRKIDASPRFLRASCIESLRALKCDAITLYQLHSPDNDVPIEESVGEMSRLKEEGKIIHLGLSNVTTEELLHAQLVHRIETVQNRCNPFQANDYDGLLAVCEHHGVSYLPHSVTGGSALSQTMARQPLLVDLAEKYCVSPQAIIVAWHLAKSDRVIPIPGASRPESATSSASASRLSLDPADIRSIDALGAGD